MEILLMNKYSNRFIDKYIFKFMNKLSAQKPIVFIAPQKQAYNILPFMSKISVSLKNELAKSLLNDIIITIIINVQLSSPCFHLKMSLFTSNFEDFQP